MVNLHKVLKDTLAAIMAVNKAEYEGRDVTVSDLKEAHELLTSVERDKEGEKVNE